MRYRFLMIVLMMVIAAATRVSADVYVSNANASITVYATNATGNAVPVRTIAGAATNLNSPEGITVDTVNNELYVADFFGQAVRVYALNANGNAAPVRELINGPNSNIGQPRMVAVDTVSNEIYVATIHNEIIVFPRTASGDAVPIRTISGAATLIKNPISISLDMANDELLVDSYDVGGPSVPGILVFNRTDSGNVAPKRLISGGNTQIGTYTNYVRVDAVNNEIFSQGDDGLGVVVFSRTASGNIAPLRNLTGASTGLLTAGGLLPDLANNTLIVADTSGNSLRVYSRTATGNVAPLLTVSGPATGLLSPSGIDIDSTGGFIVSAAAQTVPAMNKWGLILFVLLAGLGAAYHVRRRRAR